MPTARLLPVADGSHFLSVARGATGNWRAVPSTSPRRGFIPTWRRVTSAGSNNSVVWQETARQVLFDTQHKTLSNAWGRESGKSVCQGSGGEEAMSETFHSSNLVTEAVQLLFLSGLHLAIRLAWSSDRHCDVRHHYHVRNYFSFS